MPDAPRIRHAAPEDAEVVARLLYETATGMYDVYAGGRRRALRILRIRPWKWPATIRIFHTGADLTPVPPPESLYVDALATEVGFRLCGVATALLEEARRLARWAGLSAVAIDTAATNAAAQALYERCGFSVSERRPSRGPVPGIVGYVRRA